MQVFFIRRGKLIGRENFVLEGVASEQNGELVAAFVKQFYDEAAYVPPHILLPKDLDERQIIEQWLRSKRGQKVLLEVPKRGPKRQLLEMAAENATRDPAHAAGAVAGRHQPPDGGPGPTSGGAGPVRAAQPHRVFRHLHPAGHQYRGQHGRLCQGRAGQVRLPALQDQGQGCVWASRMTLRRCARCCGAASAARSRKRSPIRAARPRKSDAAWKLLPDLLIVDGGKGQLGVAVEVLAEFGLTEVVPVTGLAKQHEELFLPGRADQHHAAAGQPGPVPGAAHPR